MEGCGKILQLNIYSRVNFGPKIMIYAHFKIMASDNFVIYENYCFPGMFP